MKLTPSMIDDIASAQLLAYSMRVFVRLADLVFEYEMILAQSECL